MASQSMEDLNGDSGCAETRDCDFRDDLRVSGHGGLIGRVELTSNWVGIWYLLLDSDLVEFVDI